MPSNGRQPTVSLEVRDAEGDIRATRQQAGNSYLDNYYGVQGVFLDSTTNATVQDVSGTSKTIAQDVLRAVKPDIAIGDSGASFSQSDNSLGNQLQQADTGSLTVNESSQQIRASASFSFTSSETIKETGLRWDNAQDGSDNAFNMFWERSVLSNAVSVVSGDSLSVTYELEWASP